MDKLTNNYNSLFLGFMAGGVAGVLAGLLFAPKSGKELRADIKETGSNIYEDTQRMVSDVEAKARSIFEDAKLKADELKKEADHRLSEVHLKACRALSCGVGAGADA